MSAVEGLGVAEASLQPYVIPITVVILIGLFAVQRSGTARVASFFGPIMVVFFSLIGILGILHIGDAPIVLMAFNPLNGLRFLFDNGATGFVTLGLVFLAVTGAEALYADMGHFGRKPIQTAWIFFVLPALLLNYLGQGALVIHEPAAVKDPFFLMVPGLGLDPLRGSLDGGDRHRQPGRDHGSFLAHPARRSSWGCCPEWRSCIRRRRLKDRSSCLGPTG